MFYFNVPNIKYFMNLLLKETTFDDFCVRSVSAITYNYFEIDGTINPNYFSEEEKITGFSTWKNIKPIVFLIIRGKKLPLKLKIVLSLPDDILLDISQDASAMFLNIIYENGSLSCTTGSSQKSFSLDNRIDSLCEEYFKDFFRSNKIDYLA